MVDDDSLTGSIGERLGIGTDKLVSAGMSRFLKRQDPEHVEFVKYDNGYSIRVRADEESVEDAKEFWEREVEHKL